MWATIWVQTASITYVSEGKWVDHMQFSPPIYHPRVPNEMAECKSFGGIRMEELFFHHPAKQNSMQFMKFMPTQMGTVLQVC